MSALVLGLLFIVLGSLVLGQPLFVLIGGVAGWLLMAGGQYPNFSDLTQIIEMTRGLSDKEVLLAIPFFVLSGALMSEGDIARRLIAVARSAFGWLPGGMAVSTVMGCIFFAAISGSSPVTVIAIGSIMVPALIAEGYSSRFTIGLVSTAGSLGILIPPSIPMIVYAIVVPDGFRDPHGYQVAAQDGSLGLVELFLAGMGPGLLIGLILSAYAVIIGIRSKAPTQSVSLQGFYAAVKNGIWALMLPVIILGGIYTGVFTPTEAAAVAVAYALVVELGIHRSLRFHDLPRIISESTVLIGSLLVILALAQGFNKYLELAQVGEHALAWLAQFELPPIAFLLIVNILLLIVGCFMDILSAILILVPLLSPIAVGLGIHPMHLAIIVIVNLEIGYLTPPLGMNLFVASTVFRRSIGEVIRSVIPYLALMLVGLGLVTYVPSISLGPVSAKNGNGFYVPFPERNIPMVKLQIGDEIRFLASVAEDDDESDSAAGSAPAAAAPPDRPLTMEEMMAQAQAAREAEALGDAAYEDLDELLSDFRAIRKGDLLLSELGAERYDDDD